MAGESTMEAFTFSPQPSPPWVRSPEGYQTHAFLWLLL